MRANQTISTRFINTIAMSRSKLHLSDYINNVSPGLLQVILCFCGFMTILFSFIFYFTIKNCYRLRQLLQGSMNEFQIQ